MTYTGWDRFMPSDQVGTYDTNRTPDVHWLYNFCVLGHSTQEYTECCVVANATWHLAFGARSLRITWWAH